MSIGDDRKFHEYVDRAKAAIRNKEYSSACEFLQNALRLRPEEQATRKLLNETRAQEADARWNVITRFLADATAYTQYLLGMRKAARNTLELLHKSKNLKEGRKSKRLAMAYAGCVKSLGEVDEAIEAYELVRQNFTSNEPALFALKNLYLQEKRFEPAVEILSQLVTAHPNDKRLDKEMRDAQAARFSEVGVPKDLMKRRGEVEKKRLEAEGPADLEQQIVDLKKQTEKEPENRENRLKLAELLCENGRHEEALQVYDSILDAHPEDQEAWGLAAPVCYNLSRWGDAALAYERLLAFDASNLDYKQHYLDARRNELQEALKSNPNDLESKTALDKVVEEEANLKDAIYKDKVKRSPGNVDLLIEYARFLMEQKRWDEAVTILQQAKATPQRIFQVLKLMGTCFMEQGFLDLAEENLAEAIQKHPPYTGLMREDLKESYYLLGRAREDLNKLDEARAAYKELMENDINYRDVRTRFGELVKRKNARE